MAHFVRLLRHSLRCWVSSSGLSPRRSPQYLSPIGFPNTRRLPGRWSRPFAITGGVGGLVGFWCSAPAVEFLARGYRVRCLSGCPQSGHKEVGALDGHPGRWDSDLMTQAAKKLLESSMPCRKAIERRSSPNCCGALPWRRTICRILTTWCQLRIRSSSSSMGASSRSESATAGRGLASGPRVGRKGPPRRGHEHPRRRR